PPYTGWTDNGTLPPGLTLVPDPDDSSKARITGAPTQDGTYNVALAVTDANGQTITATCGELIVRNPIQVDPEALLEVFPDGCVGHGVTLADLIDDGVVIPIPGADSPVCRLENGRGNGDRNFDNDPTTPNTFPPGINVDENCVLSGKVDSKLRYGVYAWITTLVQTAPTVSIPSESRGWLPYCAKQDVKPGTAYAVKREDGDPPVDKTFAPGVAFLDTSVTPYQFKYGTNAPDPKVTVAYNETCGGACYYAYIFTFNALTGGATVSASPSSKYPDTGFEGFTHAIQVSETDQDFLGARARPRRAFVTNISFDYCIAQNDMDCGNNLGNTEAEKELKADLIRQNGGGSGYEFGLIVLPQN
ncbi:MAG TPA: Ig domain-containing protein, partial [Nannocystis sp.]